MIAKLGFIWPSIFIKSQFRAWKHLRADYVTFSGFSTFVLQAVIGISTVDDLSALISILARPQLGSLHDWIHCSFEGTPIPYLIKFGTVPPRPSWTVMTPNTATGSEPWSRPQST
jgi:hypothetical protein